MDDPVSGEDTFAPASTKPDDDYRPLASGELHDAWGLGEFLVALGPVMRLPPKESGTRASVLAKVRARRRRSMVLAGLAIALTAATIAGPLLLKALRPGRTVTAGLHGVWVTSAQRYAGRSFELSATTLALGVGGRKIAYPIIDVIHRDSSGVDVYAVRYRDGDAPLDFVIAIGSDSVAHVRNLPEVQWKKRPA